MECVQQLRAPRQSANGAADYIGEIDYFAVDCPETSGVYLVPIQHAQVRTKGSLRVHPPRNNQRRLIRLAREYEIGRVDIQPLNARVAG